MPTSIKKSRSSSGNPVETRREVLHAVGWQVQVRAGVWSPPTDVYETEKDYVVRVEIAGMREGDFEITVEDNFLVINGTRPDVPERRAYQQMEIRFGKFETAVGLPGPIDLEASRADYTEGFLTVTLPKAKPNQIQVKEET
jgi:HSP20 family protein